MYVYTSLEIKIMGIVIQENCLYPGYCLFLEKPCLNVTVSYAVYYLWNAYINDSKTSP